MSAQEKIRVMIVDDIDETRENIERLLQFDLNIEVVASARTGAEAIKLSTQIQPDVIIMDINMPDMDGITATENIRKKIPYTQVIILSVQSDSSYMRRAMLAGARDFLTKPPSINDLTDAINRAGVLAHQEKTKAMQTFPTGPSGTTAPAFTGGGQVGNVIVLYSPKGGVGTTTIATNLGIELSSRNADERVLLIDASIQYGNITVFLNEQVKNTINQLTQIIDEVDMEVIEDVVAKHSASNLYFLAAPQSPEEAYQITGDQFGQLLDILRNLYKYIIIDTSSYLSEPVQAALESADVIVLVTAQTIPSIINTSNFLGLADASGIPRDRILLIMNQFDKKVSISPERLSDSLRQEIKLVIPIDEKFINNSVNHGVPFITDNKAHPISRAIISLGQMINDRIKLLESEE
jgi:pilus assembly protein CpaE